MRRLRYVLEKGNTEYVHQKTVEDLDVTNEFKKDDCIGCYREDRCMALNFMINYQKIGTCPCSMCIIKVVCVNNPCEDYGTFYRDVWEVYMKKFKKQRDLNYYAT
jgi:hypothetical protein